MKKIDKINTFDNNLKGNKEVQEMRKSHTSKSKHSIYSFSIQKTRQN